MLKIKEGDLFKHLPQKCIIAHGCNAQGKMNSGFAKEIRIRFPSNYLFYRSEYLHTGLSVGDVLFHTTKEVTIANVISQHHYGRDKDIVYVDYAGLEKGMTMVASYTTIQDKPLHLPLIGGGLANGDKAILLEIFNRTLNGVDATLWMN